MITFMWVLLIIGLLSVGRGWYVLEACGSDHDTGAKAILLCFFGVTLLTLDLIVHALYSWDWLWS